MLKTGTCTFHFDARKFRNQIHSYRLSGIDDIKGEDSFETADVGALSVVRVKVKVETSAFLETIVDWELPSNNSFYSVIYAIRMELLVPFGP